MDKREMIKFKGHQLQPMLNEDQLVVPHFKGLVKNYRASFPVKEPQIAKVKMITLSIANVVSFSRLKVLSRNQITWKKSSELIRKKKKKKFHPKRKNEKPKPKNKKGNHHRLLRNRLMKRNKK